MGRKTKVVPVTAEGRDKDKMFVITEMSAAQAERWGTRALGCAAKAGITVPDGMLNSGMAGFAAILGGVGSFLAGPRDEVDSLMAEMFDCVKISVPAVPDGRKLLEDDIEEIGTRLWLRDEVLELHTGFSLRAESLKAFARLMMAMETSSSTPTSPPPSDGSSQADTQPLAN